MASDCTVDKQAIANYYNRKSDFSFIPFLGDSIGSAVMTKPQDHSSDLSNVQAQLTQTTTDVIKALGTEFIELQQDLQSFINLISGTSSTEGYVQATASLTVEPLSERITLLSVQLIALVIVVLVIIFAGI